MTAFLPTFQLENTLCSSCGGARKRAEASRLSGPLASLARKFVELLLVVVWSRQLQLSGNSQKGRGHH